jgi:hypothetical protein
MVTCMKVIVGSHRSLSRRTDWGLLLGGREEGTAQPMFDHNLG